MTRGAFIRTASVGAAGIAAAGIGLGKVARAAGATGAVTYVYPSESPLQIQQKLDLGGTVVFTQGTYDLQDLEFYRLNTNLTLRGEKSPSGDYLTKIVGGLCPFRVYEEVTVAIEDFWFDQSRWTSILIPCGNVTVRGNKCTNSVPMEFTPPGWYPGGFDWNLCFISEAVFMYRMHPATGGTFMDVPGRVPPQRDPDPLSPKNPFAWFAWFAFQGGLPVTDKRLSSVNILDNLVEVPANGAASMMGISGHDVLSPARITVSGNRVTGYRTCGIWLAGFGSSTITVSNNALEAGAPNEGEWVDGIAMYDHFLLNGPGRVYINNNNIATNGGEGIYLGGYLDSANGIDLPAKDCVISGNAIKLNHNPDIAFDGTNFSGFGAGIGVDYGISDSIQSNQITGSDCWGIVLWSGNSNALVGNNLSTFTALGLPAWGLPPAPVLLLGDNNAYTGNNHLVVDWGNGNMVSGVTKRMGRLTQEQGNRISDAVQRKKFFTMKVE